MRFEIFGEGNDLLKSKHNRPWPNEVNQHVQMMIFSVVIKSVSFCVDDRDNVKVPRALRTMKKCGAAHEIGPRQRKLLAIHIDSS